MARIASLFLCLLLAWNLPAASYVVNSLNDAPDANPGDGLAMTAEGETTLRAAIEEANSRPNTDTITFTEATSGTIILSSELVIDHSLTIRAEIGQHLALDGADKTRLMSSTAKILNIVGLTLQNGRALPRGGALNWHGDSLLLDRCRFLSNSSPPHYIGTGGALYVTGAFFQATNCEFIENTIEGLYALGGAIYAAKAASIPSSNHVIQDCFFEGNGAAGSNQIAAQQGAGGAIYNENAELLLSRTLFRKNTLYSQFSEGGAVRSGHKLKVEDCLFLENGSRYPEEFAISGAGGAIVSRETALYNSTFRGNFMPGGNGGAVASLRSFDLESFNFVLDHCTIVENSSRVGGAIAVQSFPPLNFRITNSLIVGNTSREQDLACSFILGAPIIAYSLLESSGCESAPLSGEGVLTFETLGIASIAEILDLELRDNGGPLPTYALLPECPAVDAGDPAFNPSSFTPPLLYDARGAGFPRIYGERTDLGAYEQQALPPPPPNPTGYLLY